MIGKNRIGSICLRRSIPIIGKSPSCFNICADKIIRKCVPEEEQRGILSHCHESACGGYFAS